MNSGGAAYYYHYDQLGSAINVTSGNGATQWTESYEPFGGIRTETKNGKTAPANYMKFTGEYADPTGLYHLRARQYDPSIGRFLSVDPVTPATATPYLAPYVYAAGRPTVLIDPSGRETIGVCVGASISIFHFHIGGQICIVGSTSGEIGVTGTFDLGATTAANSGVSVYGGLQVSNAPCIRDLGGPFVNGGGSIEGNGVVGFAGSSNGHLSRARPVTPA